MAVAVAHVMSRKVIYAAMDHSIEHVREVMASKRVHALPVVGRDKTIMGIVATAAVARNLEEDQPVRHVMSDIVVTVRATDPVSEAARLMRANCIHHLIVSDGKKAVGIVSSLDLLRLVEEL